MREQLALLLLAAPEVGAIRPLSALCKQLTTRKALQSLGFADQARNWPASNGERRRFFLSLLSPSCWQPQLGRQKKQAGPSPAPIDGFVCCWPAQPFGAPVELRLHPSPLEAGAVIGTDGYK